MEEKKTPLIGEEARKILLEDFRELRDPVPIFLFTDAKQNESFNDYCRELLGELALISDKIAPKFEEIGGELSRKYDVSRSPTLLINPEKYRIRMIGAPSGEEVRTLIISIIMASTGGTIFSEPGAARLSALNEKRNVKVFVSPTCPYCPNQAAMAVAAALERPGLITAEVIEILENRDLATQYNAVSVPQTFIEDRLVGLGLQPEEVFIEQVLTAAPIPAPQPSEYAGKVEKDLVIIGAGPAGLTAAIYAERSGLKSVVLEKANIGGQVALTPIVENYPGFTRIGGKALMDMMAQQAVSYADVHEGEEVLAIEKAGQGFEVSTTRTKYAAKAILLTMGVANRKLGVPGEEEFQGKGISYCAACDGYFFKGKKVIVVGGGNTAATEALYLRNIGIDVSIVHRRDKLRSEMILQRSIFENNIPVIWNTVVKEITGDRLVRAAVLENTLTKAVETTSVDGIFIAVGYVPNNGLAVALGVELDQDGYIKVDPQYRTNVPGIYAAGDITGGFKQIVTAVGQGAIAANTVFEDLAHPYWKEKPQFANL